MDKEDREGNSKIIMIELYNPYYDVEERVLDFIKRERKINIAVSFIPLMNFAYDNEISTEYRILAELLDKTIKAQKNIAMGKEVYIFNLNCFSSMLPEKTLVINPEHFQIDYLIAKDESAKHNCNKEYIKDVVVTTRFNEAAEIIIK